MPSTDVTVPTPDGAAPASFHVPEGDGPWPGVIMYPDAGGLRPAFRQMGERLSASGFAVLVPDVYYRSGAWEPITMATVFTDEEQRKRLFSLMSALTPAMSISDAGAYIAFLQARPEVATAPVGTTGYCMGGRISLIVAGALGDRIGAAASFHGGRIAVAEDPDSPHHRAADITATVYVGAAIDDASFGPDQFERLTQSFDTAGVTYTLDTYQALHGFAVPDNPPYDEAAAEQHWTAMTQLFEGLRA